MSPNYTPKPFPIPKIKGEAYRLWRDSLHQWLRSGLLYEVLFDVDHVRVWMAQLTEDTVVNGLVKQSQRLIPGITPLHIKEGTRVVVRETEKNRTVEVEFLGNKADRVLWLVMTRDDFSMLERRMKREDMRSGRRNPVCGEGLLRYQMFTRPRSPFL